MRSATRWLCVLSVVAIITTTAAADDCCWQQLCNGKDLTGWMNANGDAPGEGWKVEDGAIVRRGSAGNLFTKKRYGDFTVELEFKTDANSGILLRCDEPKNYVQTCIEVQVLPPVATPGKHSCGALYDMLTPTKEMCKKDEWNKYSITMKGPKVTVVLNGETICEADLDQWTTGNQNPDGSRNKFKTALAEFKREGHFGVQDHGGLVMYRNIRIKELK